MDKKEYLLTVLTKLEPKWNLAKGLKFLVAQGNLDGGILDSIIQCIEGAVDATQGDRDIVALKKTLKNL